MRAWVLDESGLRWRTDLPEPRLDPGEALVRVRLAGVCGTDREILQRGYAGFRGIPGHEFVGEVVRVAEVSDAPWVGRRVVGEINIGCGVCPLCRRGEKEHCPQRRVMGIRHWDGCFAEFCKLPAANLHAVPDGLADEVALFTEPLAAALEILEQNHLRPSESVVVIGDGPLGMLCGQVLRNTGCRVMLAGRHREKLAIATQLGMETRLEEEMATGEGRWAEAVMLCAASS
ncbi:MAG: alcohol dehydrogenase catalytic domain-containing protein, partial [Magnetococcales bacterium]|nr:alcohol dehydrogenase catalytic domain-containing protein [Magnetococcales bacterium]